MNVGNCCLFTWQTKSVPPATALKVNEESPLLPTTKSDKHPSTLDKHATIISLCQDIVAETIEDPLLGTAFSAWNTESELKKITIGKEIFDSTKKRIGVEMTEFGKKIQTQIEKLGAQKNDQWFKQEMTRGQIYAWVSVYVIMQPNSRLMEFHEFCNFVNNVFDVKIPNSGKIKGYFCEISDRTDIRIMESYGGQKYNLQKIREKWLWITPENWQYIRIALVLIPKNIYPQEALDNGKTRITELLDNLEKLEIFKKEANEARKKTLDHVQQNRETLKKILKNLETTETLETLEKVVNETREKNLNRKELEEIFKTIIPKLAQSLEARKNMTKLK